MANTTGSGRSQADKDRSKQMNRQVTANPPRGGRPNGQRQGNRPPQGQASGPRRSDQRSRQANQRADNRRGAVRPSPTRPRRSPTALLTWGTAALVLVIVVVLVVVKIAGGNTKQSSGPSWSPASATVVQQVSHVPASVFNAVGVTSQVSSINPPITLSGQKPLTFSDPTTGKSLPGIFFYGAEYCPFCAAARWSLIVALSRFGTFHKLGNMQSSSTDIDPNTQTFTFSKASYTSPYIAFKADEYLSNQATTAGTGYTILMKPTPEEARLVTAFDTSKYFPQSLTPGSSGFPFIDFGNKILQDTLYDPSILQNVSRDQIAGGLSDAKNPITAVIVAGANYLSASVCHMDGAQPAAVCSSKGVQAAAKALKLS
jgi:uncharacterized protein DUF929